MKKAALIFLIIWASNCHAAIIARDGVVGCPSISDYDRYVELAHAGQSNWIILQQTGCEYSQNGDEVTVLGSKLFRNLVRTTRQGDKIDYWYASEDVGVEWPDLIMLWLKIK